jgi:hypothetical protein
MLLTACLQEASGVLAEVSELTGQNQALNKQFMALAGERGASSTAWLVQI